MRNCIIRHNSNKHQKTAKLQTILRKRVRYNETLNCQAIIEDTTCELQQNMKMSGQIEDDACDLQQKIIMSDQKGIDACEIQQNVKMSDQLEDDKCELQQKIKMLDQIEDDVYELQPDGGWGWIVVFSGFLCVFMIDGVGYSFGILLPYLMEDFEALPSTMSLGGSIQSGALYFISIVTGSLIERFSCRSIGITGSLLVCVGILLSSFSVNIWMFLVTFGLVTGCGLGFINLSAIVIVNRYFNKKRGTAQGCMFSGSGFGVMCISPLLEALLSRYDWRGTLLIMAGLFLQLCVASALFRPLPLKRSRREVKQYSEQKCSEPLLSHKRFLILILGVFFNQMAQMIPTTYLGKVGISVGLSQSEISWIYSIFGIMQILGRFFPGIVVDKTRITSTYLCTMGMVGCVIVCFLFPFCRTFSTLMSFSAFYGFFIAFFSVLNSVMVFDCVGLSNLSKGLSIVIFIRGPAAIIGPPIAGKIFERTKDFNITMIFAGCLLVLTSIIYLSYPMYQHIISLKSTIDKNNVQETVLQDNLIQDSLSNKWKKS